MSRSQNVKVKTKVSTTKSTDTEFNEVSNKKTIYYTYTVM